MPDKIEIDKEEIKRIHYRTVTMLKETLAPAFNDVRAVDDIEQYLAVEEDWKKHAVRERMNPFSNYSGLTIDEIIGKNRVRLVIQALNNARLSDSKKIAKTYCNGLENTNNKTYYILHIMYRFQRAVGWWPKSIRDKWKGFHRLRSEQVQDTFGWSDYVGAKMTKSGKKKKKEAKDKAPTITGTIKEFFSGKGGTKEDCVKALEKAFPDKDVESMKKTLGVQLSYHLPKKQGYKIIKKGDVIQIREPKKDD